LLSDYFNKEANIFVIKTVVLSIPLMGIASTGTKTLFQENVTIMEAIANAGILLSLVIESSYYHKEDSYRVEMHDLDLTDIKVMNSLILFATQ
jgi:polysaccharide export outer membrane protein